MPRWEYCDVTWSQHQVVISFCKLGEEPMVRTYESPLWPQLLARLGEEGWEMTGCLSVAAQAQEFRFFFKRPVEAD